ncbi:MAG: hypothetical protein FGM53_05275 [Rhodocyclaceae bacterium]|nr:hypothetical protein [Rhodocyclaceae bacterium]
MAMMKQTHLLLSCTLLVLLGCAMTQKPVGVNDSTMPTGAASVKQGVYGDPAPARSASVVPAGLALDKLPAIARARQKNPGSIKQYAGQSLHGQGKFVKTAKGNPNAVVADVRVSGLGEVSIWCRNVLGAMPSGRVSGFDGVLTGEVYTSEDFSNDVYLKDCRFRD